MKKFVGVVFILLLMFSPAWATVLAVTDTETETENEQETVEPTKSETVKKEKEQARETEKQRAEVERETKKNRIEEEKTMRETVREEKKQEMETAREQKKLLNVEESTITDAVAKRAHPTFDMLFTRMMEHATRIEQLIERVRGKVTAAQTAGTDVTEVTVLVDQASGDITTAKQQLEEAQTTYENSVGTSDPKTALESVLGSLKEVRQHMQDAHRGIRDAVKLLKRFVKEPGVTAPVTGSPTAAPTVLPTATPTV